MKNVAIKFLTLINCNYINKILIFLWLHYYLLYLILEKLNFHHEISIAHSIINLLPGKSAQLM